VHPLGPSGAYVCGYLVHRRGAHFRLRELVRGRPSRHSGLVACRPGLEVEDQVELGHASDRQCFEHRGRFVACYGGWSGSRGRGRRGCHGERCGWSDELSRGRLAAGRALACRQLVVPVGAGPRGLGWEVEVGLLGPALPHVRGWDSANGIGGGVVVACFRGDQPLLPYHLGQGVGSPDPGHDCPILYPQLAASAGSSFESAVRHDAPTVQVQQEDLAG
jgi:hypothetical protein